MLLYSIHLIIFFYALKNVSQTPSRWTYLRNIYVIFILTLCFGNDRKFMISCRKPNCTNAFFNREWTILLHECFQSILKRHKTLQIIRVKGGGSSPLLLDSFTSTCAWLIPIFLYCSSSCCRTRKTSSSTQPWASFTLSFGLDSNPNLGVVFSQNRNHCALHEWSTCIIDVRFKLDAQRFSSATSTNYQYNTICQHKYLLKVHNHLWCDIYCSTLECLRLWFDVLICKRKRRWAY